jgi:RHS repeat-associated protein
MVQQVEPQGTTSYLRTLGIDETLGASKPDGSLFLTADGLGSTLTLSDASGGALTDYTYEPFGVPSATSPTVANPFQFTGRENDNLAGLYYYRARYYHPGLQRFISEDPIGFAGGDPNLYEYVGNNPLSFRDPTGDIAIAAPVVIGGAAIVALWLASPQGQQATRDAIEGLTELIHGAAATSSESIRRAWEKLWGRTWPKDPETGGNQHAHHKKPRAEGGTDDPQNIEPLPRKEHIEHHKRQGDFKRWGKRAHTSSLVPLMLIPDISGPDMLIPDVSGAEPLGGRK